MAIVKKTSTGTKFLKKTNTGADTGIVAGGKFVDGSVPADAVFTGGNVGIDVQPTEKLSVQGIIESKSGGVKFPDATVQTTAAAGGKFVDGSVPADAVFTGGNVGIGEQPTEKMSVAGIVKSSTGGFKFPDNTVQTTAVLSTNVIDSKVINYQDRSGIQKSIQVLTEQWQNPIVIPPFNMLSSPPGFNKPERLAWSPDGKFLAIDRFLFGVLNSIEILYEQTRNNFVPISTTFRSSEMTTAKTSGSSWSPNSQYLAIGDQFNGVSNRLKIFKISNLIFERIAGPSVNPVGEVVGVSWSSKNYIAIAVNANPWIMVYKVDGETFTNISVPATIGSTDHNLISWSPNGVYLVAATLVPASGIEIFKLNSNGAITLLPSPAFNPLDGSLAIAWSRDNQFLAIGRPFSPFLVLYQRSGDTFTQITSIDYTPTNPVKGVAFAPDGKNFIVYEEDRVGGSLISFTQNGSTFTQTTDLPDNPTETNLGFSDVVFSPNGRYLAQSSQGETGVKLRATTYTFPSDSLINIKEVIDGDVIDTRESLFLGRMTTAQRDSLITPVQDGNIIYNITTNNFNFRENGTWTTGGGGGGKFVDGSVPADAVYVGGNVGIGTTSPQAKLHVSNGVSMALSGVNANLIVEGLNFSNIQISTESTGIGGLTFGDTGSASAGAITYEHAFDNMVFRTNSTEQMRIDSSGRLGIGTTSPQTKLHLKNSTGTTPTLSNTQLVVQNNTLTSSICGLALIGGNGSGGTSILKFGDANDEDVGRVQYDHSFNYLSLYVDALERMRIESNGNVGIGITSAIAKLHVKQTSATPVQTLEQLATTTEFVNYVGTENATTGSIKTGLTAHGGTKKFLKCQINGITHYIEASTAPI